MRDSGPGQGLGGGRGTPMELRDAQSLGPSLPLGLFRARPAIGPNFLGSPSWSDAATAAASDFLSSVETAPFCYLFIPLNAPNNLFIGIRVAATMRLGIH